jgi:hypothetical protein
MNQSKNIKVKRSDNGNIHLDKLIRKAIDQSKQEVIIPATGNQTGSRDS